jgi:CubicO group peptidase (beta-lactamase class C family)
LVVFVCLFLCTDSTADLNSEEISEVIESTVTEHDLPGIAVAVFSSDSIIYAGTYGVKKLKADDSLQINNLFHLGSNTKAFIVYAAASLVEEGLITWESKFFDICPELKMISKDEYFDITLFQLLRHKAGIVSKQIEKKEILLPSTVSDFSVDRENLFKWALNKERYWGGYQYSNTGYVMAAHMLEKASTQDWRTLVKERVFVPLELKGKFGWPAFEDPAQPWGHFIDPGTHQLFPHNPEDHYQLSNISLDPAGDISMTILDYVVFLQDNLKGYAGKGGILSQESYQMIHPADSYGLGWGIVDGIMGCKNISTHAGSAGTFFCHAFLFKENDFGIIIFSNTYIKDTPNIVQPLVDNILGIAM